MRPADPKTRASEYRVELVEVQKEIANLEKAFPGGISKLALSVDPDDLEYFSGVPPHVLNYHRLRRRRDELKLELIDLGEDVSVQADSAPAEDRAENRSSKQPSVSAPSKKHGPEVAKRLAIVQKNLDATASDLCEIFDRTVPPVPLPPKWQNAGFQSWTKAYKNPEYRKRIDVLLAKDRKNA